MADPKIKYDIEANVKGDAEVGQLASKLEALAKTLDGELRNGANAAAAALRELGDKQAAIARFVELKQGAQDAADALQSAQDAAQKMGQALAETETPTRSQTGQMQKLGDAVRAAKADVIEQTAAVEQARGALQQYGIETVGLSRTQSDLTQAFNSAVTAARARKESIDEVRESDRLLAIETRTLAAEIEKGRSALLAENAAQQDVAAQTRNTTEAKAAAARAAREAEDAWQKEAYALVEAAEATQRLKRETEALEDAQRTLAANDAFERQYQDARKLEQSAQYVRELGQALDKLDADQQQAAESARQATDKISNAFKTVGVRSAEELRAEIVQVREAMDTVKASAASTGNAIDGAFSAGNTRIKELERDIREVSGTLTMADKAAGLFKNAMGQITAGNLVADGVGYLVNKVQDLGAAFLGAIVDGDQLQRGLNAIYKDAGTTASQIEFLRRASSESGVAVGALGGEFVKFSASMKLANIPLEQSNALFKAVTAASASLGLGTEVTSGALNALGQMASKGVVSLEELRQQLGDRLPGAMGLTAKALGITEAQLVKLVESGGLATRDFIVPFTQALGELQGETDGLVPSFDRLKGVLTEVSQGMGDAGATTLLTGALKVLGGFVASLVFGFSTLVEGLFLFGSGVTAVAARLAGDTKAWEFFGEQVEKSTNRLTGQAHALNAFLDPSAQASAATTKHAEAMTGNTAAMVKSINANADLNAEQKLAALSTALAADATLDASAKIVQYNVAAVEMIKAQQGQTDAHAKSAAAAKEQGATMVALAQLTGDATTIQRASTQAAELYSVALDKVAVSQASETNMLVAQKAELLASAAARKLSSEDIRVETEALDKKITTSMAETEQAKQSALAQRAELYERQLATAVLKDHSAEVGKFKLAMDEATVTLKNYESFARVGAATDAEVAEKRQALTTASVLYKDSLTDLITKVDLETKAEMANLQLAEAQAKAGAEHSLSLAEEARNLGDTATAIYYEIKAREQKIATLKIEIEIRNLEAKAALAMLELQRLGIDGTTEEGQKKLEIMAIEEKLIQIKLISNGATTDSIAALEREIAALRDGVDLRGTSSGAINSETGARQASTSAIDRQTTALETQNAAIERANAALAKSIELENIRLNRDKEGFSLNTAGDRVSIDVPTRASVYETAKARGLSDADALRIMDQFMSASGQQIGGNPGGVFGAAQGQTWSSELQKAIGELVVANAENTQALMNPPRNTSTLARPNNTTPTPVSTASPDQIQLQAAGAQPGQTVQQAIQQQFGPSQPSLFAAQPNLNVAPSGITTTVNINLNGNTQSVDTNAAGAASLNSIMSQMSGARSTSSAIRSSF